MDHALAVRTSSASISAGVGIAVLHMSRVATIAPATFPRSTASSAGIPRRRPAAKAAVRASPAPIPHRTSTEMPGSVPSPRRVDQGDPGRSVLEDDRSSARSPDAMTGTRPVGGEFVVAPDQHVAQLGGPRREAGRLARVDPQARPPVEVEDRRRRGSSPARGPTLLEDPQGRGPGRLLGQQRRGHDRQRGRGEQLGRHVVKGQARLGRGPWPVEGDREAVGRPDLEERDLRPRAGHGDDRADVDPLPGQERADMVAVAVVADGGHDRGADAEPGQPGADVAGKPADRPNERVRRRQRRAGRRRGEVDADPPDDDRLDHRRPPAITPGA